MRPNPTSLLWFGAIWLIIGLLFLGGGLYALHDEMLPPRQLLDHGMHAQGEVLTKYAAWSHNRSGTRFISPGSGSLIGLRFSTPSGVIIEETVELTAAAWQQLSVDGSVAGTYLPESPSTFRVEVQAELRELPPMLLLLGVAFTSIGVGVIVIGVRKPRQQGIDGRCISVILTQCHPGSGAKDSWIRLVSTPSVR